MTHDKLVEEVARAICDDGCNWDNNLDGPRKRRWRRMAEKAITAFIWHHPAAASALWPTAPAKGGER